MLLHLFQLFECTAKLVWAGGLFEAAADAVEFPDDIINPLSSHKLTDSLKITITSALEIHILNDVVLVGCHLNHLRTGSLCLILYMFHICYFGCEGLKLPHYHIEHHHQDEADGKANGAEIRVLTTGGFGDEFLNHDIEHGSSGKSKHIREDRHE